MQLNTAATASKQKHKLPRLHAGCYGDAGVLVVVYFWVSVINTR